MHKPQNSSALPLANDDGGISNAGGYNAAAQPALVPFPSGREHKKVEVTNSKDRGNPDNHRLASCTPLSVQMTISRVGALLAQMVFRVSASRLAADQSTRISLPGPPSVADRIKAQLAQGAMSPKELAAILDNSKATLGRALVVLVKTGEIIAGGSTKGRRYSLPGAKNWESRKTA